MTNSERVYTSISISEKLFRKFKACATKLNVDESLLLSVLCYKAGYSVCKEIRFLKTIEYQPRHAKYTIKPVHFFTADHEYIHSHRLCCKLSVSLLISRAIELFIDDIMEHGLNSVEIAHLRVIQKNSYNQKSQYLRNMTLKTTINDQFEEYILKIRLGKT